MLSRDDSRSLYITGGQGGNGGHGHPHGTGGPGGTGSGPNVNIIEHQSIVYNLHPGPASQQAFQPSNIQASQTINHCSPPSRIFQGRRNILDKMHSFFTSDVGIQHIYVLYGLGGAGKTQITLKFINESSSHFSDTFFIDASTIATINTGLKSIAVGKGSGDSLQDGLLWLASRVEEWLLVFDNTDDPSINLNDFIPQCNHGNIIITSRNPGLRVYGSHSPVSDMEEEDAVALLLKSAAQAATTGTMLNATEIVKALHYLPLAIVQAGSFISKSQDLDGYLTLYTTNQARLLSEMPAQTHDHYARTVYTTWQMSFDRLTQPAAMFLQYCSFLHHNGISEQIFIYASGYTFPSYGPSKEDLREPLEFLSHFLGPSGEWDSLQFSNMTNEVQAYSLISIDAEKKLFSIHPLVHAWSQTTGNPEKYLSNMGSILGMALSARPLYDIQLGSLAICPHVELALQMDAEIALGFKEQYGVILWEAGKYKQYEKLLEGVLEKQKQVLGDNHPDTLCTISNLAMTYTDLGEHQKAKEPNLTVLEKLKQVLGDNHPDTLGTMSNLARTYSCLGEHQKAKELNLTVLEKWKQVLGDNHLQTLHTMGNLARTYSDLGEHQKAKELDLTVLEKQKQVLGDNHPDTLRTMGSLASTYSDLGEHQKAKELNLTVLEKQKQVLGNNHPHTLLTMGNLAWTYSCLGEHQKAKELKATALEKQNQFPLPTHSPSLHVSPPSPLPLQPSHASPSLPRPRKLGRGLKKQTASAAVEPAPAGKTKATMKHALQDNTRPHWR
ncbi:P-loop containing nucleoside triphosphate hydrolase protein [Mycena albidolilacea]|uniref:P-loop containing nucleoside triphosphate hydrolase protein n=1 Tax=Mycena albidolilacea TaxID=1033008 RepID=A0AAD7E659_9AGAR|nr:P-loop containing nucleoside triphosphate hydrolase protein [Mycena albidolilacea]